MLFVIAVVVMSAILHEYAHGWVAYKLGDNTAKDMGRLTLNPIPHLDPVGSVLVPLLLVFSGSPAVLAWAKPVPYNPFNLRDPKYGDLKVALGGPGTNFLLAVFFGLLARFLPLAAHIKTGLLQSFLGGNFSYVLGQMEGSLLASVFVMSAVITFINLLLMVFNLIPIPPLDGSKVLMTFLPPEWQMRFRSIEPYGIFIVLMFLFLGLANLIFILIFILFKILIGF
jgi:Zn-dependent protease